MQVVEYADATPPTIDRNPASFTRNVALGENLPDDTFTIANSGGSLLGYNISDNVSWLSVSPATGTCSSETDDIDIVYDVAGLPLGPYAATITITATTATNTPQTIAVNLTVGPPEFARVDYDKDHDVDLQDFSKMQSCLTGSGIEQNDPACADTLLDDDDDVDNGDVTIFLDCLTGEQVPPLDTTCGS
jgi:hypothetical protein